MYIYDIDREQNAVEAVAAAGRKRETEVGHPGRTRPRELRTEDRQTLAQPDANAAASIRSTERRAIQRERQTERK